MAAILLAAKLAGEVCDRWLKIPPVIGELLVGIAIGPFALGGIGIPGYGPLFPKPGPGEGDLLVPVSSELWAIGQIGSLVLLFLAGMETNARMFFRYAGPGLVVALGGVIFPFFFGAYATIILGFAHGLSDPKALFMGAIMTATSVGITARVLTEKKKLHTPEGTTILAAAVIDDVLGILILTVVVSIAATGHVAAGEVGRIIGKAVGFWLALTVIGFVLSRYISALLLSFKIVGATFGLSLAIAFVASGLAETFGLAMIIGAYSIGLALSSTKLAKVVESQLHAVYNFLVPVFFVVMGMLVNTAAMREAVVLGVVITALAIVGKVFGAGLPSLLVGFNMRGAWRIGFGMLPRGEVALIVAGIGLSRGVIGADIFGVAIMMTVVTTVIAPIVMVSLFERGASGLRRRGAHDTLPADPADQETSS